MADFSAPPVTEVVCGFQFKGKRPLHAVDLGMYWQNIKSDYPKTEDKEPLSDIPDPRPHQLVEGLQLIPGSALPRVWFVSADDEWLIQLQTGRFHFNWRKRASGYPRFPKIFEKFNGEVNRFNDWGSCAGLGPVSPVKFELTYVNFVDSSNGLTDPGAVHELFKFFSPPNGALLKTPEFVSGHFSFKLPKDCGILLVNVSQGMKRSTNTPSLKVEITARGKAEAGLKEWFDVAHESIVQGFVDITTERGLKLWGYANG